MTTHPLRSAIARALLGIWLAAGLAVATLVAFVVEPRERAA
jgi:hypothetical protein